MNRSKKGDFTSQSQIPVKDALNPKTDDLVGGEPLEGSGFENEIAEPDFEFDWTLASEQTQGGRQ